MRRLALFMTLALVVVLLFSNVTPASAIQCGPYVEPGICSPRFHKGEVVFINSGVPFVWLRQIPNSAGGVVGTLWPTSRPSLIIIGDVSSWDGYQNWFLVGLISNPRIGGWIEQASLLGLPIVPTTSPVTTRATWTRPAYVTLNPRLTYGWFRAAPSSSAAPVLTVVPGVTFNLLAGPEAVFDGVQWWWPVSIRVGNTPMSGWLEQSSIVVTGIIPTPIPQPVYTTKAAFQSFERGYMIWLENDDTIYVFFGSGGGELGIYSLSTYGSMPDNPVIDTAPSGYTKPVSGFGRVWGNYAKVRQGLGWALQNEQGYTATVTPNAYGWSFTLPDGRVIKTRNFTWNF